MGKSLKMTWEGQALGLGDGGWVGAEGLPIRESEKARSVVVVLRYEESLRKVLSPILKMSQIDPKMIQDNPKGSKQ